MFGGGDVDVPKGSLEDSAFLPYVVTKLEFDRIPESSRAPIRFELHELNHSQYRKSALIGVIYGAPIPMKGITLAYKNKWKALAGLFSISAMGFKCIPFVFDKEEDKIWVMGNRPWYVFQKALLALSNLQPCFDPLTSVFESQPLRFKLPRFPIEFWTFQNVERVISDAGKLISVDYVTKTKTN